MLPSFDLRPNRNFFARNVRIRHRWGQFDFVLWVIPCLLVAISTVLIASTQRQVDYADWHQHLFIAVLGVGIATGLSRLPIDRVRSLLIPIYGLTISCLVAVRILGTSALGAQRWLSIAGFNVQPSEFAKLSAIIVLASVLDGNPVVKPINLIRPIFIIFPLWVLVLSQPDLGTSLVFGAVLISMLYWAGMPLEWVLLSLSAIFTAVLAGSFPPALFLWIPFMAFLAFRSFHQKKLAALITTVAQSAIALTTPWLWLNALKDYQRDRLVLFLDPSKDPLGGGYHLLQSKVGIGSGGLLGTGLHQGQLTKLRFIPEQHTDFIFSALGEEAGFLGTIIVVLGFLLLLARLLNVAREARTDFESLVAIGVLSMLFFQVTVNIFMTIGLGPVTGIPLPFMSYGRSALLVNFIALGLCLSIARRGYTASKKW